MRGHEVHLVAYPKAGVSADDFRVVEVEVPTVGPGQVLVRNRWTSVDPGLRLRLAEDAPPGYFPPFPLNQAMDGIITVGEVIESRAAGFAPGDTVWHAAGWRELSVVEAGAPALNGLATLRVLDVGTVPAQAYLGPLGGMGLTAYMGLFEVTELKEGDVVWVSAAAGAVGSLVAQFAKLNGNRVIGSAGSAAKVAFLLDELGLDAAFDYKKGPVAEGLATVAPEGIDVYFDSVGGEHLEAALGALRGGGRVALCGAISRYEVAGPPRGPANLFQATANELTLRGYRGSNYSARLGEMQERVGAWLAAGDLVYRETVSDGLESAPRALVSMLAGGTIGKTIVRIA
ncbi:MAG TPA: NADP-dependent oxidoreductase [Solirubrobacterales bacterium]|nr:NADP-dependent oxidoreductase [Solirubrobacterales bacterium]